MALLGIFPVVLWRLSGIGSSYVLMGRDAIMVYLETDDALALWPGVASIGLALLDFSSGLDWILIDTD